MLAMLAAASYLIGSIPFGLIVGKANGIDPRTAGSGNIGATNVGRLLGMKFFWIVFTLDMAKGLLPTLVAAALLRRGAEGWTHLADDWRMSLLWLAVAAATILGHMFSVFLGFKGGKGVATSAGAVLGVFPYYTLAGGICILIFVGVFAIWRYISLASIVAAAAFPVVYIAVWRQDAFTEAHWPLLGAAIVLGAMIIFKHRGNIVRLRAGTENRMRR